jgi:3-phenylpropionate/cinnamic acid dioxygenase small subunit
VTNIRVVSTDEEELAVNSYLLLLRSRLDSPTFEFFSAEREDVLAREDGGLRLASRRLVVDQSTLGVANLALIL